LVTTFFWLSPLSIAMNFPSPKFWLPPFLVTPYSFIATIFSITKVSIIIFFDCHRFFCCQSLNCQHFQLPPFSITIYYFVAKILVISKLFLIANIFILHAIIDNQQKRVKGFHPMFFWGQISFSLLRGALIKFPISH